MDAGYIATDICQCLRAQYSHKIRTIFARLSSGCRDGACGRLGTGTGQREEQFKTPEKREN